MQWMRQHKKFCLFALMALAVVLTAVFAPVLAPRDPMEAVMTDSLKAPGADYPWGADRLGRDVLSRVIYGTRASLSMTLSLIALVFAAGTVLGVAAGWFGGALDTVLMRLADTMISFPGMILAIAIAGLMGASAVGAVLAIAAVTWPKYARLARSLTLKAKSADYLDAARLAGTRTRDLLLRHVVPGLLPTMVVTAGMDIGAMMLELAGLSFLGFGAKPPTPEWGSMLSEGRETLAQAPWLMLYPGLAIFVVVVVFNLLGDSLRDLLDPQDRGKPRRTWFGKRKNGGNTP